MLSRSSTMVNNEKSRLYPSHAFVELHNASDARRAAAELHQKMVRGRRVTVQIDRRAARGSLARDQSGESTQSIAVRGRAEITQVTSKRDDSNANGGLNAGDLFYERAIKRQRTDGS